MYAGGIATSIENGIAQAADVIDRGHAARVLARLRDGSRG
jgi:anthranilate phosphoribosyltransferase